MLNWVEKKKSFITSGPGTCINISTINDDIILAIYCEAKRQFSIFLMKKKLSFADKPIMQATGYRWYRNKLGNIFHQYKSSLLGTYSKIERRKCNIFVSFIIFWWDTCLFFRCCLFEEPLELKQNSLKLPKKKRNFDLATFRNFEIIPPVPLLQSKNCARICFTYIRVTKSIHTRGYQKVLSLTWKEPEIWIYSALFFNVVPFQLHTLVPSSYPVINTRSVEVNILVP